MSTDAPEFEVQDQENVEELELTVTKTEKEERTWAMVTHLSAFGGYLVGGFSFLPPLVIWLIKKDDSKFLDHQGREAVNFQLTMFLASVVSALLIMVAIGIILLPIVVIYALVYTIIAGIKANEGVWYRYPFSIKFISRAPGPDA